MIDTTVRTNKRINLNCRVTVQERDELLPFVEMTGSDSMAHFVRKALNSYVEKLDSELAISE